MSWNYYVGDPCYVIDTKRWDEFCDKLFSHSNYNNNAPCDIKWEVDGVEYTIETWDSPGGDGVWRFNKGECGVDAGLLAIVPRECCEERVLSTHYGGILFNDLPTLETDKYNHWVEINGERDLDSDWRDNDEY